MNKQISTGVGIAVVAILGVAVAAFVWFGQEPQTQVQPTQVNSLKSQAGNQSQTTKSAGIEGWKTYKNIKYGFELKYPADWPIMDIKPGECGESNVCNIIFGIDKPLSVTGEGSGVGANILIYLYIYSPEALKANDGKDATMGCKKITKVALASGLQAEKKQCTNAMGGSTEFVYTIEKNGWKYQLTGSEGEKAAKVFDQMVNSFKFTK